MTSAIWQESELRDRLARGFCEGIDLIRISGGWSLVTPFLFRDGDGLPIILEKRREGWRLSDRGATAGQLFHDNFNWSAAKVERLRRFVENGGARLEDWVITMELAAEPTSEDVAAFIAVLSTVAVLPVVEEDSTTERFRTKARNSITDLLRPECKVIPNWHHPNRDRSKAYRADLHMANPSGGEPPVVAFFVGTSQAAAGVTATLFRYRTWDLEELPVVACRAESVTSSDTLFRLEDAVGDRGAVVKVRDGSVNQLARKLASFGVPVATS